MSGGLTCTVVPGLESDVPYPYVKLATNTAIDFPAIALLSTYTKEDRTESLRMYLMWQSSSNGSIMVPIGYQDWKFQGSATCSSSCSKAASWKAATQSAGLSGGFVLSQASDADYGYPTWGGLVVCH